MHHICLIRNVLDVSSDADSSNALFARAAFLLLYMLKIDQLSQFPFLFHLYKCFSTR